MGNLTVTRRLVRTVIYTIVLFLSTQVLRAQVELVADINEGSESSGIYCDFFGGTFNQDCVVRLDDKLIFHAENTTVGRELYVLENGEAELLIDLNNDPATSDPQYLTVFNDMVYWIANDGTGYKIWQTDGTTSGTEIAFDLGLDNANRTDYTVFLVNGDDLYFVFDGSLYVYDGQELSEFTYNGTISVNASTSRNSYAWCIYQDGVAIMNYNGSSWNMLYFHDDMVENLFNLDTDDSFRGPYGLQPFSGGISFGFEASFAPEVAGRYVYLEESGNATRQSESALIRNFSLDDEVCLVFANSAFLLYDENNPTGTELLTGVLSLPAGQDWNRIATDRYIAFQSNGGVFEDDEISLLDSEDGTVETIYTGDKLSKLYAYEDNLIFFAESPNSVVDEALFRYSLATGETEQIFEFQGLPFNDNLYPIGIQDEHFYFYGNLDDAFGTELYSLPVDFASSVQGITPKNALDFVQVGAQSFLVQTSIEGDFEVDIFNVGGQLIQRQVVANGATLDIPYSGIVVIATYLNNTVETHLKVVTR